MDTQVIAQVFLPIALGIIMFGLGLTLTMADFRRVVLYPRAVLVGLAAQMLLLPWVCLAIAIGLGLSPVMAVGLMLLAASPGGATANFYSHLAKGDVALNITLTAINSVLAIVSLPIIVNLSLAFFMGTDQEVGLQFQKVLQVFAIVLVPVGLGMVLHQRAPRLTHRMEKPFKLVSIILFVIIVAGAVASNFKALQVSFAEVGLAALAFNVASLLVGYVLPRLAGVSQRQAIAVGMEIGIHNGTLAMYVAASLLLNEEMALPAAVYSLVMFITAGVFGFLVNRGSEGAAA